MSDNILLLTEGEDYLVAENGDYLIAVVQYLTTAINGTYAVSGQQATLLKSKVLAAQFGNYSVVGRDVGIVHGYEFGVLNGVYSLIGNNASIVWTSNPDQLYVELRSFTERRRI